jgi:hypothetical protein
VEQGSSASHERAWMQSTERSGIDTYPAIESCCSDVQLPSKEGAQYMLWQLMDVIHNGYLE